ncbi:type II toxin-antitoxin system VapC family toxin [Candidatus Shapirobacteria bacterium]|nr:type II toxin-antitoxin system VapC family toxin [Candidatus Shapirobacteria bacterium]
MSYIIDSDILIWLLKKKTKVVELLESIDMSERGTSIICIGEVLEGLNTEQIIELTKFFGSLRIYDVNLDVIFRFAELRKTLRRKGLLLENMDLLIAATCLANNLTLVTGNVKHFKRIKGLKIKTIDG